MKNKGILLLRTDKMGDFILSINPILQLKKSNPNLDIDIVINKANYNLAKSLGIFRNITTINPNSSKIRNLISFLKDTKGKKYDYAIDLISGTNHLSSILQLFSRATNKVGVPTGIRKYFLTKKVTVDDLKYETELVYDILGGLVNKKKKDILFPFLRLDEEDKHKNILSSYRLKPYKYMCVYPIIEGLEKKRQWPLDYYADLIKRMLVQLPNIKLVIIGTSKDRGYIESIVKEIKNERVVNLAGKLTLLELIYLFDKCLFSLGGLAGPSHISAVICGRPSFCIVGGTPIRRWTSDDYPYIIIKKSPACYPCEHLKECVNKHKYRCLDDISVKDVMDSVKKNMSKRRITGI